MKANSNKCHLITNKQSCMNLNVGNINTENSSCEKLVRVHVHIKLNFIEHLHGIIKKTSRNVSTLSWIFPFMDLTKRDVLMNLLFTF